MLALDSWQLRWRGRCQRWQLHRINEKPNFIGGQWKGLPGRSVPHISRFLELASSLHPHLSPISSSTGVSDWFVHVSPTEAGSIDSVYVLVCYVISLLEHRACHLFYSLCYMFGSSYSLFDFNRQLSGASFTCDQLCCFYSIHCRLGLPSIGGMGGKIEMVEMPHVDPCAQKKKVPPESGLQCPHAPGTFKQSRSDLCFHRQPKHTS